MEKLTERRRTRDLPVRRAGIALVFTRPGPSPLVIFRTVGDDSPRTSDHGDTTVEQKWAGPSNLVAPVVVARTGSDQYSWNRSMQPL